MNRQIVLCALVTFALVPSVAAQGLGVIEPSTTHSTSNQWHNTSVKVFDPSDSLSEISVRPINTTNYRVMPSYLNTSQASPVSKYYISDSYSNVYSIPLRIRLDGTKQSYDVDAEIESRAKSPEPGPIPVVSKILDITVLYNGPLRTPARDIPDIKFRQESSNSTQDNANSTTKPSVGSPGEPEAQLNQSSGPDGDSNQGLLTPVLVLFISLACVYIIREAK